ncbi:MAG TPA: hypothetical protein DD490_05285 [Acidobacteria bacterium]|nr:hypothetical protein [Acidobacteriota bacterium]
MSLAPKYTTLFPVLLKKLVNPPFLPEETSLIALPVELKSLIRPAASLATPKYATSFLVRLRKREYPPPFSEPTAISTVESPVEVRNSSFPPRVPDGPGSPLSPFGPVGPGGPAGPRSPCAPLVPG